MSVLAGERERTATRADNRANVAHRPPRFPDATVIGLLAACLSAAGSSRPSLWYDEAATIAAAQRSIPELWSLLSRIDAVHGLYYLLMHGWLTLFPPTEFWVRLPSSIAVGIAAAGVVVLARQLSSRRVAVAAGVVFAILPRTTWAGIEARSYAFSAMVAVWVTVLLVVAVRRNRAWLWLVYGAALPVATVVNLHMVLLVVVHAVVVLALTGQRSALLRWLAVATLAVALEIPFLLLAHSQIGQVFWIYPVGGETLGDIFVRQYFDRSTAFAICAGLVVVAAILLHLGCPGDRGSRRLVIIALAWMLIPTATLLVYSLVFAPMYYPRYLTFTAPAMALLLGVCIARITRTPRWTALALVALALAAESNFVVTQRGPYAKEGFDYSQIADVVAAHAAPGDCLLLDNTTAWKPGPIRPLVAARAATYQKLVDPGRGTPALRANRLWDGYVPIWRVQNQVAACDVLWTISEKDHTLPDHDAGTSLTPGPRLEGVPVYQIPHRLGFRIVERWQFSRAQITESVNAP